MADLAIDLGVNAGNSDSVLGSLAGGLGDLSASALDATSSLGDVGVSAEDMSSFMDVGERRADALAQAQNDVAQASLDMEQATVDSTQAQNDANQATLDGVQAQQDFTQARRDGAQSGIDVKQALLDQKIAQKEYNEAVGEFGKNSLEAEQASINMSQADEDLKQAKEDAKQATIDGKQALLSATQATTDHKQAVLSGKQATIDGKNAQLGLNQAQRDVVGAEVMNSWIGTVATLAPILTGLIGVFQLLQGGMLATATASISSGFATAAAWLSTAASAVASGLAIAGAWLLSIWPIALVIAAVVGITILVIKNWDTIRDWTIKIFTGIWNWLQGIWADIVGIFNWAFRTIKAIFFNFTPLGIIIKNWGGITGWITRQWNSAANAVSSAVGRIGGFFNGMWDGITEGLKWALNGALGLINDAIYAINVLISGANRVPGVNIPFIPYIPYLAEGGITTGPTLAMIGEGHEQEAVLPLSKLQSLIGNVEGGGRPVILQISGGGFREFLQENVRVVSGGDVVKYAGGA